MANRMCLMDTIRDSNASMTFFKTYVRAPLLFSFSEIQSKAYTIFIGRNMQPSQRILVGCVIWNSNFSPFIGSKYIIHLHTTNARHSNGLGVSGPWRFNTFQYWATDTQYALQYGVELISVFSLSCLNKLIHKTCWFHISSDCLQHHWIHSNKLNKNTESDGNHWSANTSFSALKLYQLTAWCQ